MVRGYYSTCCLRGGKRLLLQLEPFGFIIIFLLLYAGLLERVIMPVVAWVEGVLFGGRFG